MKLKYNIEMDVSQWGNDERYNSKYFEIEIRKVIEEIKFVNDIKIGGVIEL